PPPPRSTLFPYTTLFRSLEFPGLSLNLLVGLLTVCEGDPRVGFAERATQPNGKMSRHPNHPVVSGYLEDAVQTFCHSAALPSLRDRKSTRLNSSHSQISY